MMLEGPHQRNAFLNALSASDLAALRSHLAPFDLRVGSILHDIGDRIDDIVFPQSGLVAMSIPLKDEAGAATTLIGRDNLIGGLAVVEAPAHTKAEVHIGGQASRMSATAFRYVLDQHPNIRRLVALFDVASAMQAHWTSVCNAVHPVEARFCRWLLEIHDRIDNGNIALTQSTLSQMLGVRRTTITLVAGRLEAVGAFTCRRGYITVTRRAELEQRSCECYSQFKGQTARLFAGASINSEAALRGKIPSSHSPS
jgi:CRP-like cAMP-binding protein